MGPYPCAFSPRGRRRPCAFTLAEALVSLALMGLAISVAGDLLTGFQRSLTGQQERLGACPILAEAVGRISADIEQAVQWSFQDGTLTLVRPALSIVPIGGTPRLLRCSTDPRILARLTYSLDRVRGLLIRQAPGPVRGTVAVGATGFDCRSGGEGIVRVTVEVRVGDQTWSLSRCAEPRLCRLTGNGAKVR